ncbi:MAG: hypothetical protein GY694_09315 [Gammaproteobacteria bacterium]|nr:hypothetical protein [Gammaproteobacteria bacterium]MCP4061442.1 hypothetical protein [Pseudoalteromonas sp.]
MSDEEVRQLAKQLEADLLKLYGSPMLSGEKLQRAMGYRTVDALRQAILRKTIPVKVFKLANRRGQYALVKDVALWLANQARND